MPRWAEIAGHTLWFYYNEEHQRPHVAVRGEHRATMALDSGEVLAGHLPPKLHQRLLVDHRHEAYAAWEAVVVGVRVLARYILELTFETGEVKVLDVEPLLNGPMFEPLIRDYDLFKRVRVDAEAGTIMWPNGADISPRTLYRRSRDTVPHAS